MLERPIFAAIDADDLPRVLELLRREGCRTVGVSDAASARHILSTIEPALVIVDYPELADGGFELVEYLSRRTPPLSAPKLALLEQHDAALIEAAMADGFQDVYVKPISSSLFLAAVRKLLPSLDA